jgi:hypothetical protein
MLSYAERILRKCSVFPVRAYALSPFSREAESNSYKAKADNHVPCTDTWHRILSLAHVEDYDPEEANQEVSHHNWGEPTRALRERGAPEPFFAILT